ncbi:MAG: RidA family protein [Gammaproteobacteria bacterium]|nr:RidA family protein [Gammaproteobacteria bacterium]
MSKKEIIATKSAPGAIGTYSQAVRSGNTIYISGQIPLDPETMDIVDDTFEAAANQVFSNLEAIAAAAGGSLEDAVKLTIYMTDLANFATVNTIMAKHVPEPYPARAAVGVASLPKGVPIEIDAILVIG